MTELSKGQKLDQYIMRFPEGLREKVKASASKNGRSLNAELVHRVQESFRYEDDEARSKKYVQWLESGGLGEEPELPEAAHRFPIPDHVIDRWAEESRMQHLSYKVDRISEQMEIITSRLDNVLTGEGK